jgi:hypothetical protein
MTARSASGQRDYVSALAERGYAVVDDVQPGKFNRWDPEAAMCA